MAQNVAISGSIIVGAGLCVPASGIGQGVHVLGLGGACSDGGLAYQTAFETRGLAIATAGAVGDAFVALPGVPLASIEFLYLKSNARFRLRWTVPGPVVTVSPDFDGLFFGQFSRSPLAPTLIEISCVATIDIVAAGVPA